MADSKVGVFDFLENHLDYRVKLLMPVLLIAGGIFLWNYVRDLQQEARDNQKEIATIKQKFEQVGSSAVAGNQVANGQKELNNQAKQNIDPQILAMMQQQNATIQSLTKAIGVIEGRITTIGNQPTDFGGHQETSGALNGFNMEESRKDISGKPLPPTTSINLSYKPGEKDPNKAFVGTTWQHYTETYTPVIGQWEKKKDGGYKTTIGLSRTISKPDPTDPTKQLVLGKEDIPITDANTVYAPDALKADAFKLPRWTATLGFSRDGSDWLTKPTASNGYQAGATLDYRVTNKYGVTAGVVNKAAFLGLSIRFGGQKQ